MSDNEHFENVVLGGGEAGKYIAWELARAREGTAVTERALIGGCDAIFTHPTMAEGLTVLFANVRSRGKQP
ncbi:MAG: hypothetical protein ACREVF_07185 [Burkholderiales bacterium]